MNKKFLSIFLLIILILGSTLTVHAADVPESENADYKAAKEAGFTYEQYEMILDMPDFEDEVYKGRYSSLAMRPDQQAVVNMALSFQGVPYVWGGTSPAGFDCSGLVQYVYAHAVGIYLPRVTTDQERQGKEVSLSALLPGDLLFWGVRGSTHHVAIYIGNNQFIQAPKPGDVVRVTGLYQYYPNFARRILPDTVAVSSIALNKYYMGLSVGESGTLIATVNPANATNKDVIWSSSDPAVASVYNGRVTAKAVGTATITATNKASGKSTNCSVYVVGDSGSFIKQLYVNALGRQPDATSLNNFKSVIKNESASKAVSDIFNSTEYLEKNHNNDQFVTVAYKAILGRNPDSKGKQSMLNLLNNGMSRTYILSQIMGSEEFLDYCADLTIRRGTINLTENRDQNELYTEFVSKAFYNGLGRKADSASLNAFTGILLNGGTGAQTMKDIFESTEYKDKNKSNEAYIQDLYATVLMRGASSAEISGWVNELNSGKSRYEVLRGFVNTNEFAEACEKYGVTKGSL